MNEQVKTVEQFFRVRRQLKTKDVVISNAFKDEAGNPIPWKIKALNVEQIQAVAKASLTHGHLDQQKNQVNMLVASVVSPNLRNAELQDFYEVTNEADLLKAMLLPTEYAKLYEEVVAINELQTEEEAVKEAKNY